MGEEKVHPNYRNTFSRPQSVPETIHMASSITRYLRLGPKTTRNVSRNGERYTFWTNPGLVRLGVVYTVRSLHHF